MIFIKSLGDRYGSSSLGTPSVRGHYRPVDNDSGFNSLKCNVRVDHVGSQMGKSGNTSDIRGFLLPYSQCEREKAQ